jgi:hypothetical protein
MRRTARRLFTLCSAASLLLCVAVCVLWARSYWVVDMAQHVAVRDSRTRLISVRSDTGRVVLFAGSTPGAAYLASEPLGFSVGTRNVTPTRRDDSFWGFEWAGDSGSRGINYRQASVPHWVLSGIAALGAFPLLARLARGQRRPDGCCRSCGYGRI